MCMLLNVIDIPMACLLSSYSSALMTDLELIVGFSASHITHVVVFVKH